MSDDVILEDEVQVGRLVSLAEVREMLEKAGEEREEMLYEQKIALEHARRFSRVDVATAQKIVDEVMALYPDMDEKFAIRIADLTPQHVDDVMSILQKARQELTEDDAEKVLAIVDKHYVA